MNSDIHSLPTSRMRAVVMAQINLGQAIRHPKKVSGVLEFADKMIREETKSLRDSIDILTLDDLSPSEQEMAELEEEELRGDLRHGDA